MTYQLKKIRKELDDYFDSTYKDKVDVISIEELSRENLLEFKPDFIDDKKWVDNCRWIIHCIIQLSFDKRYSEHGNQFVPLYSKILKKICGNNYSIYIKALIEAGIIETDGEWTALKHKSLGFKLTDSYAALEYGYFTLTEHFLTKAIRKHRKDNIAALKVKAKPIAHLVRWLTKDGLDIDKKAALEFLESYRLRLKQELRKRKLKTKFQNIQEAFIQSRYQKARHLIKTWGDKSVSIDDSGGRLYSPLTSMPSIFRNFLTYKGQTLVSFDIKNSQPLHFLIMLEPDFWKDTSRGLTLKSINEDLYNYLREEEDYPTTNIMFPKTSQVVDNQTTKFTSYKELVQAGKLYEFICFKFFGEFLTPGGLDRFSTRNLTKTEVLHMMYHDNRKRYSTAKKVYDMFKTYFPEEAKIMDLMKRKDYKDFPVTLQKIEAKMLLHNVAKKVYDMNPEIPLFTIHDSIATTEAFAGNLKGILNAEYQERLGFLPQIEETTFTEHNAWMDIAKYVKAKVNQADLEVSKVMEAYSKLFNFIQCEHWDFDIKYRQRNSPDIIVPPILNFTIMDGGTTSLNTNTRQLKKISKK